MQMKNVVLLLHCTRVKLIFVFIVYYEAYMYMKS